VSSVDKVNRELARLDSELRAGSIDRATFRAQRRRLLLDFEERQTTTQPSDGAAAAAGTETTQVDPPVDAGSFILPEPPPVPSETPAAATKRAGAAIAVYAVGAILVLGVAGWWFTRPISQAPPTLPAPVSPSAPAATQSIAGADTPQTLAAALAESEWSEADVANFLTRWQQLSPEAIAAATEDSRVWLLRGETGRRLREARETESLEQSVESKARVEQLERVQNAVGTP
jgi:hypothetical protein